jgi:uncharacterized membrane protein YhaH (DUF805 family)
VSFADAVTTVLTKKYADFSGRARRSEYWFFSLATFVAYAVAFGIGAAIGNQYLYILLVLAIIVPSLAVSVRRLHDTNRSGWWILIGIVPIVGPILLLVWYATDSEAGTNQYGPSPKGSDAQFDQYGAASQHGTGNQYGA